MSLDKFDRSKKTNAKALKYFIQYLSVIVGGIEHPYKENKPIKEALIDNLDFLEEEHLVNGDSANYLAYMTFNLDVICHNNGTLTEVKRAHDLFFDILKSNQKDPNNTLLDTDILNPLATD